jgi:hypothetical protein
MINYKRLLRNELPEFCHEHIAPAFSGDVVAVMRLLLTAPNESRPVVVHYLWLGNAPLPALQTALADAWEHDHQYMHAYFKPSKLRALFKEAGKIPNNLPPKVTVWRGGRWHHHRLVLGLSWTTTRAVACWFAAQWGMIAHRVEPGPLVVRATVDRRRILHASNERCESEVIICGGIPNAAVDGTLEDWVEAAKLHKTN